MPYRIGLAVVLVIAALVLGVLGTEPTIQKPEQTPAAQVPGHTPSTQVPEQASVTIRDGQVTYGEKYLTHTGEMKKLPTLSPDGRKVAFYALDPKGDQVGIVTVDDQKVIYTDLSKVTHTDVMSLDWLTNDRVGFYAHLNPSAELYAIIDARTGDLQKSYYGVGFTWSADRRHLFYAQLSPHFSPWDAKGREKLMRDGEVMYETPELVLLSPGLGISSDEKLVAFYEYDNQERWVRLVIAETVDGRLSVVKKINWEMQRYNLTVRDDGTLSMRSGSEQFQYNWREERKIN